MTKPARNDDQPESAEPLEEWSPRAGWLGKLFAWVLLGLIAMGIFALVALMWQK